MRLNFRIKEIVAGTFLMLFFTFILWLTPSTSLCANHRPSAIGIVPSSGYGYSKLFYSTYRDSDGWRDIRRAKLLFNATCTGKGGVYLYYNNAANRFYLFNGARWLGGFRPRASATISTSLATLYLKNSYAIRKGSRLVVRWHIGFGSRHYGKTVNTYCAVTDRAGADSRWARKGGWRVPIPARPTTIDFPIFPADNTWNTDISHYTVDHNSDNYIANMAPDAGLHPDFGTVWNGGPIGIPYCLVAGSQPKVPITFYYPDESDPGPYPIPPDAPIEYGSDHHILVIDVTNRLLYEVYDARKTSWGWSAGSGAKFDLTSNRLRPDYWTSADAAGLPIFPGLVRYDEVQKGEINHALRFTVSTAQRAFIHPATHFASDETDPNLPPMGLRVRLKASFDISPYSRNVQVILRALKKYGMFVADIGADWYISGAPDSRWNDEELHVLDQVHGSDFEVVQTGPIIR